ncbi:MAG TPA: iron uptake transporter permease EfeU [Anaerolineales bacterium]|nr:iron uptake transporter permease EfeU [Anaerolineales bacterium]
MLASFLLSLREGIEAALIIGIVLGALRKLHRTEMAPAVWYGALSAVLVSLIAGVLLTAFGLSLEGAAEEVFEGVAMLLAAAVLTWMIFWMNRQARSIKGELELGVDQALSTGGTRALFSLAFLAVVREGVELALFLTAATFASDPRSTILGSLLGIAVAILLGWGLFASTVRLNLRHFFQVTGVLLILFAAGLVAHGVHEFNEAGWIPSVVEHVWDINPILDEESTAGSLLKALFGYNGNPSLTEVLAYLAYFVVIYFSLRSVSHPLETRDKSPGTIEA